MPISVGFAASSYFTPSELGAVAVESFLTNLATAEAVSASTQNQALAAILFLYSEVLGKELESIEHFVMAKRPRRLPVVLSRDEAFRLLSALEGLPRLMASLLARLVRKDSTATAPSSDG